ncbi:MAG: dihydrofolate reductase [Acidobacteriota bacterium]
MSQGLSLVVAVAENGVIGRDGGLPWRLSGDLRFFKKLTVGHTILMGRKTFESIGRPLPKRRSIVLTRRAAARDLPPGVEIARSLEEALERAAGERTFVIGGAGVYRAALPAARTLHWTRVHAEVPGDTYFPPVDWSAWRLESEERHPRDAKNEYDFTLERYSRITTEDPSP